MNLLENIRNKYNELNNKLEEIKNEEREEKQIHEQLALEYKEKDEVYQSSCEHFTKIENRINKRKEKFANKKCSNHVCLVAFGTALASLIAALINIKLGFITQPFYAYCGVAMLGCIAAVIDMELFWNKIKEKSFEKFEELESTQRTRNVSDIAYTEKLKAEREMRESQENMYKHSKTLDDIKRRKRNVENQINDLKLNSFSQIMNSDSKELDGHSLTLK